MKLVKCSILNEVIIINIDGSIRLVHLVFNASFCSNYHYLENYLI